MKKINLVLAAALIAAGSFFVSCEKGSDDSAPVVELAEGAVKTNEDAGIVLAEISAAENDPLIVCLKEMMPDDDSDLVGPPIFESYNSAREAAPEDPEESSYEKLLKLLPEATQPEVKTVVQAVSEFMVDKASTNPSNEKLFAKFLENFDENDRYEKEYKGAVEPFTLDTIEYLSLNADKTALDVDITYALSRDEENEEDVDVILASLKGNAETGINANLDVAKFLTASEIEEESIFTFVKALVSAKVSCDISGLEVAEDLDYYFEDLIGPDSNGDYELNEEEKAKIEAISFSNMNLNTTDSFTLGFNLPEYKGSVKASISVKTKKDSFTFKDVIDLLGDDFVAKLKDIDALDSSKFATAAEYKAKKNELNIEMFEVIAKTLDEIASLKVSVDFYDTNGNLSLAGYKTVSSFKSAFSLVKPTLKELMGKKGSGKK